LFIFLGVKKFILKRIFREWENEGMRGSDWKEGVNEKEMRGKRRIVKEEK